MRRLAKWVYSCINYFSGVVDLNEERCKARTIKGQRCTCKSVIMGYCMLHFNVEYDVKDERMD